MTDGIVKCLDYERNNAHADNVTEGSVLHPDHSTALQIMFSVKIQIGQTWIWPKFPDFKSEKIEYVVVKVGARQCPVQHDFESSVRQVALKKTPQQSAMAFFICEYPDPPCPFKAQIWVPTSQLLGPVIRCHRFSSDSFSAVFRWQCAST